VRPNKQLFARLEVLTTNTKDTSLIEAYKTSLSVVSNTPVKIPAKLANIIFGVGFS
jgi:hypothetical protein